MVPPLVLDVRSHHKVSYRHGDHRDGDILFLVVAVVLL